MAKLVLAHVTNNLRVKTKSLNLHTMYTFFTRKRVFQRAELSENGGFRMIVQL